MKFVRINIDGTMDECNDNVTLKNIRKIFESNSNNKGSNRILHLYTWNIPDYEFRCYGWTNGKAGKENKHDLPPAGNKLIDTLDNSDTQLLFGDICIIRKDKKLCDLDVPEYASFYSECFGGFDDCNSSDDDIESSDDEGSLTEFIVEGNSDDNDIDEDYKTDDDDIELDEDNNDY